MRRRLAVLAPGARIEGFTVQAMARRPEAHELIVGAALDPVFGPVVLFGHGGVEVEALDDYAVALPPLNQVLARDLVSRARVARLLLGYRGRPAADHEAIYRVLIAVGQLMADLPEVVAIDVNPLLADRHGVLALDARVEIAAAEGSGVQRFAILPYPQELEQRVPWRGGDLVVRPIRPEDAPAHVEFFESLDPADVRARAMGAVKMLRPGDVARPRDGLHRDPPPRRRALGDPGRGPKFRDAGPRERGVRHRRALRTQGQGARGRADGQADRALPSRRGRGTPGRDLRRQPQDAQDGARTGVRDGVRARRGRGAADAEAAGSLTAPAGRRRGRRGDPTMLQN
jgi:hypothetical protein